MKRVLFFLITNIAILLVLSIFLSLIGFTGILQNNGIDLDNLLKYLDVDGGYLTKGL